MMITRDKTISKYKEKDLIKSDTGENLVLYWLNIYNKYPKKEQYKCFEENLKNLLQSKGVLSLFLSKFSLEHTLEKIEIHLIHCLVINHIINISLELDKNPIFEVLINDFIKKENCKVVYDKVINNFNAIIKK